MNGAYISTSLSRNLFDDPYNFDSSIVEPNPISSLNQKIIVHKWGSFSYAPNKSNSLVSNINDTANNVNVTSLSFSSNCNKELVTQASLCKKLKPSYKIKATSRKKQNQEKPYSNNFLYSNNYSPKFDPFSFDDELSASSPLKKGVIDYNKYKKSIVKKGKVLNGKLNKAKSEAISPNLNTNKQNKIQVSKRKVSNITLKANLTSNKHIIKPISSKTKSIQYINNFKQNSVKKSIKNKLLTNKNRNSKVNIKKTRLSSHNSLKNYKYLRQNKHKKQLSKIIGNNKSIRIKNLKNGIVLPSQKAHKKTKMNKEKLNQIIPQQQDNKELPSSKLVPKEIPPIDNTILKRPLELLYLSPPKPLQNSETDKKHLSTPIKTPLDKEPTKNALKKVANPVIPKTPVTPNHSRNTRANRLVSKDSAATESGQSGDKDSRPNNLGRMKRKTDLKTVRSNQMSSQVNDKALSHSQDLDENELKRIFLGEDTSTPTDPAVEMDQQPSDETSPMKPIFGSSSHDLPMIAMHTDGKCTLNGTENVISDSKMDLDTQSPLNSTKLKTPNDQNCFLSQKSADSGSRELRRSTRMKSYKSADEIRSKPTVKIDRKLNKNMPAHIKTVVKQSVVSRCENKVKAEVNNGEKLFKSLKTLLNNDKNMPATVTKSTAAKVHDSPTKPSPGNTPTKKRGLKQSIVPPVKDISYFAIAPNPTLKPNKRLLNNSTNNTSSPGNKNQNMVYPKKTQASMLRTSPEIGQEELLGGVVKRLTHEESPQEQSQDDEDWDDDPEEFKIYSSSSSRENSPPRRLLGSQLREPAAAASIDLSQNKNDNMPDVLLPLPMRSSNTSHETSKFSQIEAIENHHKFPQKKEPSTKNIADMSISYKETALQISNMVNTVTVIKERKIFVSTKNRQRTANHLSVTSGYNFDEDDLLEELELAPKGQAELQNDKQYSDKSSVSAITQVSSGSAQNAMPPFTGKPTKFVRDVKQAYQCHECGEVQDFNDDIEYLVAGLRHSSSNTVAMRCLSAISLGTKCLSNPFRTQLRAQGLFASVFSALRDAAVDQNLSACTMALFFTLSTDTKMHSEITQDPYALPLILKICNTSKLNNPNEFNVELPQDIKALTIKTNHKIKALIGDVFKDLSNDTILTSSGNSSENTINLKILENHLNDLREQIKHSEFLDPFIESHNLGQETLLNLLCYQKCPSDVRQILRENGGLDLIAQTIMQECEIISSHSLVANNDGRPTIELNRYKNAILLITVLENVIFMDSDNQNFILKYQDGNLITALLSITRKCLQALVTLEPLENSLGRSLNFVSVLNETQNFQNGEEGLLNQSSAIYLALLIAVLKLFVNVTHENDFGAQTIVKNSLHLHSNISTEAPFHLFTGLLSLPIALKPLNLNEKTFDLVVLIMCFLINLMEHCENNKHLCMTQRDTDLSIMGYDALKSIVEKFFEYTNLASHAESDNEIFADYNKEPKLTEPGIQNFGTKPPAIKTYGASMQQYQQQEQKAQKLLTNILERAGADMEYSLVASYIALFLGCFIQNNETHALLIKSFMPREEMQHVDLKPFEPLIVVLRKFVKFVEYSAACGVSTIKLESISKIIRVFENFT